MNPKEVKLRERLEAQKQKLRKLEQQYNRERRRLEDSRKFLLGAAIQEVVASADDCLDLDEFRRFLGIYVRENDPRAKALVGTAFEPIRPAREAVHGNPTS